MPLDEVVKIINDKFILFTKQGGIKMNIRNTVKAIIIHNDKILLNKCEDEKFGAYFSLPGGGQHVYETLHEAVVREVREETGFTVTPTRFAALCETIFTNKAYEKTHPNNMHRVYHVFICEITNAERILPTEKDKQQTACEWVPVDFITASKNIRLFPAAVSECLNEIIAGTSPIFLGTNYQN